MNYLIAIHKDDKSDYGVSVPDLPGCFSAGSTIDEAIAMAREAVELHLEGLIEAGERIPVPKTIERHRKDPNYADAAVWGVVQVDLAKLPQRAVRLNITMPERVLERVDRFVEQTGDSRSGLLVRAVTTLMAAERIGGEGAGRGTKGGKAKAGGVKRRRAG